jgi:hypothetical protein
MALVSVLRRFGPVVGAAALAICCTVADPNAAPAQGTASPNAAVRSSQTSPKPGQPAAQHAAKRPLHGRKAKPAEPTQAAVVEPPHPPDPPPPNWPVNNQAVAPTVDWNGRDLTIAATNSSLEQILRDVSTATGVKVQGIASGTGGQRVYGSYGPAPARDVLSQLLEGSGYNVLMVGDQGQGTPRELVLTSKTSNGAVQNPGADAQAGQSSDDDASDQPEQPEQPEQPDPNQRRPANFPQQMPGQTREQIMQQMQMRQLQMQQQQQQQQQQQPEQAPPQFPNQEQ